MMPSTGTGLKLVKKMCDDLDLDFEFEKLLYAECMRRTDVLYAAYKKGPQTRAAAKKLVEDIKRVAREISSSDPVPKQNPVSQ